MSPPEWLLNSGFPKELVVLLIAVLPVLELRVAIPVGINTFGMPWYHAFPLAFIGNLLPVPIIILFLEAITRWLSKIEFLRRALDWLFEHTRRRGRIVEKYKRIGLVLFVAVPLPITGAWTGSLVANLFGLKFRHAFLSILTGVFVAGLIVTGPSLLGWVGVVVAIAVFGILAVFVLWKA